MKRKGFTLAEVLVVLGIIGVVAALTLPSLMSDTSKAQIGPKLAKSVSMFDQASAALLESQGADSFLDTDIMKSGTDGYGGKLTDFLKSTYSTSSKVAQGSSCTGLTGDSIGSVTAKDGVVYTLYYNSSAKANGGAAHKDKIGSVSVDLNGAGKPNEVGFDQFAFTWWADGSLKPAGGENSDSGCSWTTQCKGENDNGTITAVTDYWACAGHVFENDFKVKYE